MKSIYRSIIMKTINKELKKLCLLMMLISLCIVSGCGKTADADREEKTVTENENESKAGKFKKSKDEEPQDKEDEELQNKEDEEPQDKKDEELQDKEDEKEQNKEDKQESGGSGTPVTMAQLMGEKGGGRESTETEELSDTILWFNATYATLTYSNGWNWKLIGGLEMTESNQDLQKSLLRSSWKVNDKDSALETIDWLKEEGHRESCRKCMEELQEMGLLDLKEEEFLDKFMESGIEENVGRYLLAYYMNQEGLDAEYMAAWDLCRVNQMYADCYFCGYLTYEEAMDGALENSLLLQQMYPSWEDMMSAYMLGYQFWQNDLMLTDDSPTLERYNYYEMLLKKKDGPYTLDWNMKLEKDW